MTAVVGAKRDFFPDGSAFESIGIRPDVEVSPRAADLRAGRGRALEEALRVVGR